jgi:hypothetical protein
LNSKGNLKFGNFGDFEPWPYQVLGVSCALLVFLTVFAGMAYSKLYNGFMKTPESEEKDPDWVDVTVEMTDQENRAGEYVNMEAMEESVCSPAALANKNVSDVKPELAPENGPYVNPVIENEDTEYVSPVLDSDDAAYVNPEFDHEDAA